MNWHWINAKACVIGFEYQIQTVKTTFNQFYFLMAPAPGSLWGHVKPYMGPEIELFTKNQMNWQLINAKTCLIGFEYQIRTVETIFNHFYIFWPLPRSWRGHLKPVLGPKIALFKNKSNETALNQHQNMFNLFWVPDTNCWSKFQPFYI